MSARNCVRHMLAQGVVAQVEYCADCAVLHLSMESITVRFRATALRDLRDTLSAALENLREAAAADTACPEGRKILQ